MTDLSSASPWSIGAAIQARTVGALIMRELHTRFGRRNIGYLWIFLEPALLAAGVATVHAVAGLREPLGMQVVPFYVTGYTIYCVFRSVVNRSGTTIEANGSLLYHRHITVIDLLLARTVLEAAGCMIAGLFLLFGAQIFGLGTLPQRPLLFLAAWGFNLVSCFGLSMLALAACLVYPMMERLIHPATYLMLPVSGVFLVMEQLPAFADKYISWIPMAHIAELVREGEFAHFNSPYLSISYLVIWCVGVTFFGLLAIRATRHRVEL